jgi:site-specific recombinase XerC
VAYCCREGVTSIENLQPADVRRFRASWNQAPSTRAKLQRQLQRFSRFAVKAGWLGADPTSDLESIRVVRRPTLPFDRRGMARILNAIDAYEGDQTALRALVLLLRYSGLRLGDAACLERSALMGNKLRL